MIEVSDSVRCGYSAATICPIIPPIDMPTICALAAPTASITAIVSAAMSNTV